MLAQAPMSWEISVRPRATVSALEPKAAVIAVDAAWMADSCVGLPAGKLLNKNAFFSRLHVNVCVHDISLQNSHTKTFLQTCFIVKASSCLYNIYGAYWKYV